ncbi:ComEA family DNA-binding protein [Flavitalea sp.]|nr:helix-hairpin-helix domain-containing protein [Flavitalea sp.]
MRETIKEYLTFSKKERTGILILLSIIIIIAVAPSFYSSKNVGFGDSSALHEFKDQIAVLDAPDNYGNGVESISSSVPRKYRNDGKYPNARKYPDKQYPRGNGEPPKNKVVMFDFDPNTISTSGWIQLGVSERTAMTIDKYRSKGGKFRKADDILRIYGLPEEDKMRLLPFVKITTGDTSKRKPVATDDNDQPIVRGLQFKRKVPEIIDVNTADTSGWSSLPGIGPVLSQRIIKYRDRLGGFYSVEQVAEVYGLQDSVYQKIRPFLTRVAAVHKINVNAATPDILEQHPYLKRQLARAIVDYRSQHGIFKEIGELRQVVSITPELFDRISHYIGL